MDLSKRQAEVVERVARGLPDKLIAAELGIAIRTVRCHIQAAVARIPDGNERPRHRLTLFFFGMSEQDQPVGTD